MAETAIAYSEITILDLLDTATYIYYSQNSNGEGATIAPNADSAYIGIYSGKALSGGQPIVGSEAYNSIKDEIQWSKYKGDQGNDGVSAVTCRIDSSSGFSLKDGDSSTLTARIFVGTTEIDLEGRLTYNWYRSIDGSDYTSFATGKSVVISEEEYDMNMDIYFDASGAMAASIVGQAIVGQTKLGDK